MSDPTRSSAVSIFEPGQLHVGTAKVDITSPADALPPGYTSIHDPVYARAIVLDNGKTRAVLLGADLVGMVDDAYEELTRQICDEAGCPQENILIPDDSAYERQTCQVLGSRIQKGCAEQAIVHTLLDLMEQSMNGGKESATE